MPGPILEDLVPGDREIECNWINDPSVNIHNAFLFVLNKSTNVMTKLNLTDDEALNETYLIGDPSMNLTNGVTYMVQYVQQQGTSNGNTFGSNTKVTVPAGLPNTPELSLLQVMDGGVNLGVQYTGNNGSPYTSIEFRIADTSNNIMTSQEIEFPGDAPVPGSLADTSYVIVDLSNNTPYDIACYVYNANGSCSQISNTISINPTDQPNAPSNLAAASGQDGSITVTFKNSSSGQPGGVVVSYWAVYKALSNSTSWSLLTTLSYVDLSYNVYEVVDTDVQNGGVNVNGTQVGYQYKVNGVSTAEMEGVYAGPVTALPFKPVEIGSFAVIAGDEQAACAWTLDSAGATFVSPANIVYYDLEYGEDLSYNLGSYLDLPYNKLTQLIPDLTNGDTYSFRVRAKSLIPTNLRPLVLSPDDIRNNRPFAIGEWVYQNEIVPATVPGAPTQLSAAVDSHLVQLNWLEPADNGGAQVLGYRVYQYATELDASLNLNAVLAATIPLVETATIMGLVNGTSYWFRVTANNVIGEGPLSDLVGPAIPYDSVNPPILLDAVQLDASSSYIDISLNWSSPLPEAGIVLVSTEIFEVAPNGQLKNPNTGALNIPLVVPIGEWDTSFNDGTFGYSVYIRKMPAPSVPGIRYALRMVAENPNFPGPPPPAAPLPPFISSVFAFENLFINRPPTIVSGPTVSWDPLAMTSYYRFSINTYELPLLSAVLYAPPASDVLPLPTPITMGSVGASVEGIYTFEVDYEVVTTPVADQAYFVVFTTAGGAASAQSNI
jgi:hypothetical protein